MGDSPDRKLIRKLLAATCLTAAAGAAQATTFTESTDFSNTFAGANLLPVGTDVVIGSVGNPSTDTDDYFELSGLTAGTPFDVNFTAIPVFHGVIAAQVLDSSDASLGTGNFDQGMPLDLTGTIPSDGVLVVRTQWEEGGPYQVTLHAVPEPATGALVATGVAALVGRRRKPER